MNEPLLIVSLEANEASRTIIRSTIGQTARIVFLGDLDERARTTALAQATAVLARNTDKELRRGEAALLTQARLLQFVTAGVDHIPLAGLPTQIAVASNGGAYAEPMAEHALAMALAALKRLAIEQGKLERGTFDQFKPNRMLAGATCGIVGFGGIGAATARLMRALGARVFAINRRGVADLPVDWIGTTAELGRLLAASNLVVLSLPLTPASQGSIGAEQLGQMKRDAILINMARGEIVDEAALYAHLLANSDFTACIDAWWVEPVRHGHFRIDHPFLRLPNVIASPHNSASVAGWRDVALRRALENVRRSLEGGEVKYLVPIEDRMR